MPARPSAGRQAPATAIKKTSAVISALPTSGPPAKGGDRPRLLRPGVDVRRRRSKDLELPERTLVEGAEDGVIDQRVRPGNLDLELDDGGTAGRDGGRLHVVLHPRAPLGIDAIEDLPDDVKAAGEVGTAVAHVEAHGLTDLGDERVVVHERPFGAVEHHV